LDEDAAKFYAAGILEGLTYMHHRHDRRHIIHRDLKPQNVMVDNLGYPVLIDLGLGKSIMLVAKNGFRAGSHYTFVLLLAKYVPDETYTCCGIPMYMAPEFINFMGHDKGIDQW
jgi:serine/threonine protein kinase